MFKKGRTLVGVLTVGGFMPQVTLGAGLIPCNGTDCHFSDLIVLVQQVLDYLIFYIAMPLAAISFCIAGFMLVFAKGNPGKIEQAKKIFWYVLWGLVIALGAWIAVQALLIGVGLKPEYWLLG